MPKEIYPSSYICDCGHESHFFANTIREAKAASRNKEIRLGDSEANQHTIVFFKGKAVCVKCPERGVLSFLESERDPNDSGSASKPPKDLTFRPGDKVIWLKRIPGGDYAYPVSATVLGMTAKRIKIEAEDDGGTAIKHVPAESLQRRGRGDQP